MLLFRFSIYSSYLLMMFIILTMPAYVDPWFLMLGVFLWFWAVFPIVLSRIYSMPKVERFILCLIISSILMGLFITAFTSTAHSMEKTFPDITVKINRVYDGDTIFVDVPNVPLAFGEELGVRIRGIDTPEIRGKCDKEKKLAQTAKALVEELLSSSKFLILKNVSRDMYFRLDADVTLNDGSDLAEILLKTNLARPYDGTTAKTSWCD